MSKFELQPFTPKTELESRVWDYIKSHDQFGYRDLETHIPAPRNTIRILVGKLKKRGCIRLVDSKGNRVYFTARSVSEKIADQLKMRSTPEGAMWTAIRILGAYSIADVVYALVGTGFVVTQSQVKAYMQRLLAAEYLHVIRRASPDSGREAFTS